MAQPFKRVHSDARRHAVTIARVDKHWPISRILAAAAAGDLVPGDPFKITAGYVSELARREVERRAKTEESPLANAPHRDAVETLRRRCVSSADKLLTSFDRILDKDPEKADPERLRQIVRVVREAAALPERKDETPRAPGSAQGGPRTEQASRHGEAGRLIAAMRQADTNGHSEPAEP